MTHAPGALPGASLYPEVSMMTWDDDGQLEQEPMPLATHLMLAFFTALPLLPVAVLFYLEVAR
jgi:hypothetical protein